MIEIKEKPYNKEVEQSVLAALLMDDKLIGDIIQTVSSNDFYVESHKDIYKAMAYLHHNNQVIDYTNVMDRLAFNNVKYDTDYVFALLDSHVSAANFPHKVEILLDLSHKRALYEMSEFILTKDIKGVTVDNLVKMYNSVVDGMNITSNIELVEYKTYAEEWYEEFKKPKVLSTIKFGYTLMDEFVMLENSDLGIIGARPSVGKSAYALNLAKNVCLQRKNVLFVSLEMSASQVMNRLVANMAGVEHNKIHRKEPLTDDETFRMNKALEKIKTFNLNVYDKGSLTVDHLYNLVKKLKKQKKIDFLILDYMQLLNSGKNNNSDNSDISYISRRLKQLAMDVNVPIIALSQLSRASVDTRTGKIREPQLSDLRQSGSLEQDANFVLMLHTEDTENKFEDRKFIKLFIRKNRSGSMGTINMTYYGNTVHFEESRFNVETQKYEPVKQEVWDAEFNENDIDLPF